MRERHLFPLTSASMPARSICAASDDPSLHLAASARCGTTSTAPKPKDEISGASRQTVERTARNRWEGTLTQANVRCPTIFVSHRPAAAPPVARATLAAGAFAIVV